VQASAKKLRVREGKTMVGCAVARAFADFAEAWGCGCDSGAKAARPEVLPGRPGKGPKRKEASLLT
jgi:hypothetical protein